MDQITFVVSGLVALSIVYLNPPNFGRLLEIAIAIEAILLFFLAIEIVIYADLKKGR